MATPNTTFRSFILSGVRFSTGDSIMVKNGSGTHRGRDFVGRVERIRTDSYGDVNLDIRWYYRPEEVHGGRKWWHGRDEVLESSHVDVCPVNAVNCGCRILSLDEYETEEAHRPAAEMRNNNKRQRTVGSPAGEVVDFILPTFFCRSFYDHHKRRLREELPKYCICNQPANPDKLLICCDGCEQWFHGRCVGLTKHEAADVGDWLCSACHDKIPSPAGLKRKAPP